MSNQSTAREPKRTSNTGVVKEARDANRTHDHFAPGEGYASGEKTSEYQHEHRSAKQYGDNPTAEEAKAPLKK